MLNLKKTEPYRLPMNVTMHLNVRSLLLLPKSQSAKEVEESANLLWREVVHIVQNSLYQIQC